MDESWHFLVLFWLIPVRLSVCIVTLWMLMMLNTWILFLFSSITPLSSLLSAKYETWMQYPLWINLIIKTWRDGLYEALPQLWHREAVLPQVAVEISWQLHIQYIYSPWNTHMRAHMESITSIVCKSITDSLVHLLSFLLLKLLLHKKREKEEDAFQVFWGSGDRNVENECEAAARWEVCEHYSVLLCV